jgi:uncharacterized protein with GYD domain
MSLYVLATRISSSSLHTPETLERAERQVMKRIREECRDVRWLSDLVVCGPYDYIDIFDAPSLESALKVSVLVRTYGHSHAEIWPALGWDEFERILARLPHVEEARTPKEIDGD